MHSMRKSIIGAVCVVLLWSCQMTQLPSANSPTHTTSPSPISTSRVRQVLKVSDNDLDIVLTPETMFVLQDAETEIAFINVHKPHLREDLVHVTDGLPYVKIDGRWLEIINNIVTTNEGYTFHIHKKRCYTQSRNAIDYSYNILTGCAFRIRTTKTTNTLSMPAIAFEETILLAGEYNSLYIGKNLNQLFAVRPLGISTDISSYGDIDGIRVSLDIITKFGVANKDINLSQQLVIGHEEQLVIGPQQITLRIIDPCRTICRNAIGLKVTIQPIAPDISAPIRVLEYS